MKISLVTASLSRFGGGVSAVVQALSRSLVTTGTDVGVIGLRDRGWPGSSADWAGIPISSLRVIGPCSLGYAPEAFETLRRAHADVVHSHGLWKHTSRVVTRWAAATGRPYVVSPHGMLDAWALKHAAWKKKIAARLFEEDHLRRAGCLHALCDAEASAIRAFGLTNPICVVSNGITLPPVETSNSEFRPKVFASEGRIMLFIGRLHPKKNLPALIEAWPTPFENSDWRLMIAGWDQDGHEAVLRALVKKRGLEGSIRFLGPLFGREKDAALRAADAFVLPSLSEGLPMAVLEAWSYGLPVLQTDACNLLQGFARNAAFRISTDTFDMANDLRAFMRLDPATLSAMGRSGRVIAEHDFCWSRVATQMLAVYKWILEGGAPPACVCLSGQRSSHAA